jgi:hypothetical protein
MRKQEVSPKQEPSLKTEGTRQPPTPDPTTAGRLVDEERRVVAWLGKPEPVHATDEMLRRVQGEFLEMPGLRLTEPQARRLWGLDAASCSALIHALVDANFLFRTRDGAFMRVEHAVPGHCQVDEDRA